MMTNHILEIAIFTVKPEFLDDIQTMREKVHTELTKMAGFISIDYYAPCEKNGKFVDMVKWQSLETAQEVAKLFQNGDEKFLPYLQAIESVAFMGHFQPAK